MSELITMDFGDTQLACWPGPHSTSPQGSQAVGAKPPLPSTSGRSRCLLLTKSSQKTRGRKAGPHQHRQGHCGMRVPATQMLTGNILQLAGPTSITSPLQVPQKVHVLVPTLPTHRIQGSSGTEAK